MKKKLDNRRLDYDAKLNKTSKKSKDSEQINDELKIAQTKYETTLQNIIDKMNLIKSNEVIY